MNKKSKNLIMFIFLVILIICSYLTMSSIKNNNSFKEINGPFEHGEFDSNVPELPSNVNMNGERPEKPNEEMVENDREMPNEDKGPMNGEKPGNNSSISTIYYVIFTIESLCISLVIIYLIMSNFNDKSIKETFSEKNKIIIYIICTIIITTLITFLDLALTNKFFLSNDSFNPTNFNNNSNNISYSSNKEITSNTDINNENLDSSNSNENALLVSGKIESNLTNVNVSKTGDSSLGDDTSFYGVNSAILAKDGSTLNIKDSIIETNATGANGVFSYGGSATTNNSSSDNTTINISDTKITTTKDNSGGIMTTGGGIMNASNLTITTSGISSAAIRSDRGGGTVNVDGGTYTTNGKGSPTIYSTANISVKNATLVSNVSEGIVIEGKNSVTLDSVNLTDSNKELNGKSTTYKNIFLYQSMSGDASDGTSEFTSKNSTITTNNGDSFYVTNTSSVINLENNKIINNDKNGSFLRIQKDSWGNSGSNGGNVTLNLTNQNINGNIVVDEISSLDIYMKNNSYFEGIINEDNSSKSITLTIDNNSKIKLLGDSYIDSLNNFDSSNSNIDFNGYKLYVNNKAIN